MFLAANLFVTILFGTAFIHSMMPVVRDTSIGTYRLQHVLLMFALPSVLIGKTYPGMLVMDARSASVHVIFCSCFFIFFFMGALVGQTAERIYTKLSHVVDIRCYLRTY